MKNKIFKTGDKMDFLNLNPNKTELYAIITGIFCGCLVVSNIIAAKTITDNIFILPSSIILFPIVYVLGDILTEIYGFNLARKTIILGLIVNVIAVLAFQLTMFLPGTNFEIASGFDIVFSTSPRILFACFCSYFTGSYVNAYVMKVLKERFSENLFFRCVMSTIFGESADSIIFITVTFFGTEPIMTIITMIVCQVTFKVVYEVIAYPLTKYLIKWMRTLEERPLISG